MIIIMWGIMNKKLKNSPVAKFISEHKYVIKTRYIKMYAQRSGIYMRMS